MCRAAYVHELFWHEEMMGIRGNAESIQNWNLWIWEKNDNSGMLSFFFLKLNIFRTFRISLTDFSWCPNRDVNVAVQKTFQFGRSIINFQFWYHDGMPKDAQFWTFVECLDMNLLWTNIKFFRNRFFFF